MRQKLFKVLLLQLNVEPKKDNLTLQQAYIPHPLKNLLPCAPKGPTNKNIILFLILSFLLRVEYQQDRALFSQEQKDKFQFEEPALLQFQTN